MRCNPDLCPCCSCLKRREESPLKGRMEVQFRLVDEKDAAARAQSANEAHETQHFLLPA